jgi:hypothetical protein
MVTQARSSRLPLIPLTRHLLLSGAIRRLGNRISPVLAQPLRIKPDSGQWAMQPISIAPLRATRKRNPPEPFKPRRYPTWSVARDALSQVVPSTPLEPYGDLRAALMAARDARIADGWDCESVGRPWAVRGP